LSEDVHANTEARVRFRARGAAAVWHLSSLARARVERSARALQCRAKSESDTVGAYEPRELDVHHAPDSARWSALVNA